VNETRLTGLENLRTRFARLAALPSLKPALRDEAEAVARLARANLSTRGTGELARSIDVAEMKTENLDGFRVGTDDPAGFFVEFGTFKEPEIPGFRRSCMGVYHALSIICGDCSRMR